MISSLLKLREIKRQAFQHRPNIVGRLQAAWTATQSVRIHVCSGLLLKPPPNFSLLRPTLVGSHCCKEESGRPYRDRTRYPNPKIVGHQKPIERRMKKIFGKKLIFGSSNALRVDHRQSAEPIKEVTQCY